MDSGRWRLLAGDFFKPLAVKAAAPVTPAARRWPLKTLLVVLSLAATAYALALLLLGGGNALMLQQSAAVIGSAAGAQAALLCTANYVLRGLRWRIWMRRMGRPLGLAQGLRLYLAGYAFTPTPGNVGEALRGVMLAQQPLTPAHSLAIFSAERLADLLCLLLLCLPAMGWAINSGFIASAAPVWLWLAVAAGLTVLSLLALGLAFRAQLQTRLNGLYRSWLHPAWLCLRAHPVQWLALSLSAWAAQGAAVWLIAKAFGYDLGPVTAAAFYAVAMVAGALSALPAGLGGTEVVLTSLLVAYGTPAAQALGITVVVRLLTLWLAVGIGLLALLYSAAIRKDLRLA